MTVRLPLFPLGTVLFPGLVLPLHIFEERYRTLVRDLPARADEEAREFGVVAIRRGSEVRRQAPAPPPTLGGTRPGRPEAPATAEPEPATPEEEPPELYEVGCTAELRQVTELPDGGFDIVTVGKRRFRVLRVDEGAAPYLTGEVDWLAEPESEQGIAELLAPQVLAAFRRYLTVVRTDSAGIAEQLPEDPTVLSHLVAATAALTIDDRQALLAEPDTAARLRAELRLLNRESALLTRVRAVPVPLAELGVPETPN